MHYECMDKDTANKYLPRDVMETHSMFEEYDDYHQQARFKLKVVNMPEEVRAS